MITIFNRRELFITYSMESLAAVRRALEANGIGYNYRFRDLSVQQRLDQSIGMFVRGNPTIEYKVYVKRKDYDRAKYAARL